MHTGPVRKASGEREPVLRNDEPNLVDELGRDALIRDVGDHVATCETPEVFGVHGDWGLGKTSFLHQVHYYLTGECPEQTEEQVKAAKSSLAKGNHSHVSVVWFEAWRYQQEDVPVVALLHEIRSQLSWQWKLGRQARKTAETAVYGALTSMEDLTKKIGIQASKFQAAGEKWERENLATALPSHTMREQLRSAIGQLLPKRRRGGPLPRVAVLIDDLDRCEGAAAYRLLEGLKIYLTIPNCIFVLGVNQKVIEEAIAAQIPASAPPALAGRAAQEAQARQALRAGAYLEKLCQNVWRLPLVQDPDSVLYAMMPDDRVRDWVASAIGDRQCLPPNPRRLKALASVLDRFANRLPGRDGDPQDQDMIQRAGQMLVVAYIYQFHHELFRLWENDLSLFHRLLDWVRGAGSIPTRSEPILPLSVTTTGEQEEAWATTHPDPTEANVFWIQSLVVDLALSPLDGFAVFLRGSEHA